AIRQAEVGASKTMIERIEQRFDLKPERLAADSAYASGANLNWLVNDTRRWPRTSRLSTSRSARTGPSRDHFTFDKERNVYICPAGKLGICPSVGVRKSLDILFDERNRFQRVRYHHEVRRRRK